MLFHSLNPFIVSSPSLCFLEFFSSLLGAGVGLFSDVLLGRKSGGLTFLTLNEEAQRCQEGCWDQYQLLSLPTQISKAQRECHLSCGWLQADNVIETLSPSLSLGFLL